MTPRVLFVGSHLELVEQMDQGLVRGLRAISCHVETFDYRATVILPRWLVHLIPHPLRHRLSPRRWAPVERADAALSRRQFLSRLTAFRPQILIALQAERLRAEEIRAAHDAGCVTINWLGDEPWRMVPPEVVPHYDLWLVIDQTWMPWLKDRGAPHVKHLPVACDPVVHRPALLSDAARARWASRLCFVGGYGPARETLLSAVADLGLAIWGPGWEQASDPAVRRCVRDARMLRLEEWLQAFAAADLVINIHAQGHECLNLKIFEALAAQACLISDYKVDLDRFLPGVVETFRTPAELRQRCQALLADPATRQARAHRGREYVLAHHTFAHRAQTMLDWAQELRRA